MKIFISGGISDRDKEEYTEHFNKAERYIRSRGYEVFNPTGEGDKICETWIGWMRRDIKELMDCDAIYMLNGWQDSRGACLERYIARELEMIVFCEGDKI